MWGCGKDCAAWMTTGNLVLAQMRVGVLCVPVLHFKYSRCFIYSTRVHVCVRAAGLLGV